MWARYEKRARKRKKTPRVTSHPLLPKMTSEKPSELANLIIIDTVLNFVGRVWTRLNLYLFIRSQRVSATIEKDHPSHSTKKLKFKNSTGKVTIKVPKGKITINSIRQGQRISKSAMSRLKGENLTLLPGAVGSLVESGASEHFVLRTGTMIENSEPANAYTRQVQSEDELISTLKGRQHCSFKTPRAASGSISRSMTNTRRHLSTSLVHSRTTYFLSPSFYSRTRSRWANTLTAN